VSTIRTKVLATVWGALFLIHSFAASAFASDLAPLYGVWGNEAQCTRALITPKGTKRFAPFDIRPDWLGHGDIWCRLGWSGASAGPERLSAVASALCGEDTILNYRIKFNLTGEDLTLVWSTGLENGPLQRCEE